MKKIVLFIICAMLAGCLCACNPDDASEASSTADTPSGITFNDGTGNAGDLPQIDVGSLGLE